MAKCLDCGQIYCTYGGSEGSSCPICRSANIDASNKKIIQAKEEPKALSQYQSKRWDMDISLEDLLENNPLCKVDRSYKAHKYDDCYHGYCMYVNHPGNTDFRTNIGIFEDGFTYIGDGGNVKDLPLEKTMDVIQEMFFYGEWVKAKQKNMHKAEFGTSSVCLHYKSGGYCLCNNGPYEPGDCVYPSGIPKENAMVHCSVGKRIFKKEE